MGNLFSGDPNVGGDQGSPANQGLQVDYKEFIGHDHTSPTEELSWDVSTGKRTFDVAWADRKDAVWQILGKVTADKTNPTTTKLTRHLPESHPSFPQLIADKISVQGLGVYDSQPLVNGHTSDLQYDTIDGKKIAKYQRARIAVSYSIPDYPIIPDTQTTYEWQRYTSVKIKPNGDYLTLPVGFLKWGGGDNVNTTIPGSVGKVIPTMDILLTWHQVAYEALPLTTIFDTIGTVNHKTAFGQYNAQTLLLTAVDIKRLRSPYGTWAWDIGYTFKFFSPGHNKLYDLNGQSKATRTYFYVTIDGATITTGSMVDGTSIFNERDIYKLWNGTTP